MHGRSQWAMVHVAPCRKQSDIRSSKRCAMRPARHCHAARLHMSCVYLRALKQQCPVKSIDIDCCLRQRLFGKARLRQMAQRAGALDSEKAGSMPGKTSQGRVLQIQSLMEHPRVCLQEGVREVSAAKRALHELSKESTSPLRACQHDRTPPPHRMS